MKMGLLALGLTPTVEGIQYGPLNLLFVIGAVAISHPFEVVRIKAQYEGAQGIFGSSWKEFKGIYNLHGYEGLYVGFLPRALYLVPSLAIAAAYFDPVIYQKATEIVNGKGSYTVE